MFDDNALNIYTDGSSYSSSRRGGIGIRLIFPQYMNKDELIKDFDFSRQIWCSIEKEAQRRS